MREKSPKEGLFTKATEWMLGKEFGHDQKMSTSIIEDNPENRDQVSPKLDKT
jgi:hypothetical protein